MRAVVVTMLRIYKYGVSPLIPASCRFTPTCSEYAIEAINKYGILKGGKMSIKRILRCNPFGSSGYDPVR